MVMVVRWTEMFAAVMAFAQIFGVFAASIAVRHEDIDPELMRHWVAIKLDGWNEKPEYQISRSPRESQL
jgi:hypothetical protein